MTATKSTALERRRALHLENVNDLKNEDELGMDLSLRDCVDALNFIARRTRRGEASVQWGHSGAGFGVWLLVGYVADQLARHVKGGAP